MSEDPRIAENRVNSLLSVKFLAHQVITPRKLQIAKMSHQSGGGMALSDCHKN